jgi:hypothetical protein
MGGGEVGGGGLGGGRLEKVWVRGRKVRGEEG